MNEGIRQYSVEKGTEEIIYKANKLNMEGNNRCLKANLAQFAPFCSPRELGSFITPLRTEYCLIVPICSSSHWNGV